MRDKKRERRHSRLSFCLSFFETKPVEISKGLKQKVKMITVKIIEPLLIILTVIILTSIFCLSFAFLIVLPIMVLPSKNFCGRASFSKVML